MTSGLCEAIAVTVTFGSPGSNRPLTGARKSSTMAFRPRCDPSPRMPVTCTCQTASSWKLARICSRSPELRVAKNSRYRRSYSLFGLTIADCSSARGGGVDFGERLARDAHRVDAGRNAAVDGDLQEDLADLLARDAVRERALHVQLELVRAIERGDHGEVDQTPVAPLETWPAPDAAPAVLGRELLHRLAELVRRGERAIHVVVAEHGLAYFEAAPIELLVHVLFPRSGVISHPARVSTVRATEVQSESGPYASCVLLSSSPTERPTVIGTPRASASSRHMRTSLSARPVVKPKSNPRVSTCFGNLSAEATLRPLETLITSSISRGSRPALTPSASASAVIAIAACDIRLLASLSVCPRPGFSPTWNTRPSSFSTGS